MSISFFCLVDKKTAIKNQKIVCKYNFISRQRAYLEGIFQEYGSLRFYTLVDLSHTVGSPWDLIRNKSKSEEPVGLLIPESLIESYFKSISGKNVSVNW